MEKITENVHHLPELVGGPTLILGDDGVTLVDAGLPDAAEAILDALRSLGREPADLKHIVITHADPDHVGGLAALVAATGADVYAGEHEADVIEGKTPMRNGETREPVQVAHRVEPGETLPLHGGLLAIDTNGHTVGHLSYFLSAEGVAFAGDAMTNTDGLTGSLPQFTADPGKAAAGPGTIAALGPSSIVFGHGPSLIGDAAEQLRAFAGR
jgi:glyoxylase-like metal-dependent hydrolase (beta-lactamase superfamily II)